MMIGSPKLENKPVIAIVAALLPEFGIGNKGQLPWRLKKEMKYFKAVTTSCKDSKKKNAVIMGRKTWESIPKKFKPLPDRYNFIISRSHGDHCVENEYVHLFNSLEASISFAKKYNSIEKIFIIGGSEIYNYCFDYKLIDYLLLTEIKTKEPDTVIEMDSFLTNFPLQFNKLKVEQLEQFITIENSDEFLTKEIDEGDFKYNFSLWKKATQSK